MTKPRIVNLANLPWRQWRHGERVAVEFKDPARHLGTSASGLRIERLAPGMQASPPHRHHFQEEMFLVLRGRGLLRHGGEDVPVAEGDFIVYRAGDPEPHTFLNDGPEPLELIATGNRVPHEVCEFPGEGTVYVEALDRLLSSAPAHGFQPRKGDTA